MKGVIYTMDEKDNEMGCCAEHATPYSKIFVVVRTKIHCVCGVQCAYNIDIDLKRFLESNKIFTCQDHFRAEKLKSKFIKSI